jgi:MFS family permease
MSAAPPGDPAGMRRVRVAISVSFLAFGMTVGLWFAHVPLIAARLQLEPGVLGVTLLCFGITGLLMQTPSGLLVARYGSRIVARLAMPAFVLVLLVPVFAPSLPVLVIGLILMGIVSTPAIIAANTQAAEFEQIRGRSTMSSFHGFFSVGGLVSAALGGYVIGAGLGDGRGAALIVVVLLVATVWSVRALPYHPPSAPSRSAGGAQQRSPLAALGAVIGLAVVAVLCTTIEGSVGDWSGIYLLRVKGSDPGLSTAGFAMFSLAMAACRFTGGPVVERLGNRTVVVGGGVLMAVGMAIVVLTPWPLVSALGYLVVAAGAANITPLLTSAAGRSTDVPPSVAISAVSTAIMLGLLSGPPVIGFIAQLWGLDVGMAFIGVLGVIVAIAAARHRWSPSAASA